MRFRRRTPAEKFNRRLRLYVERGYMTAEQAERAWQERCRAIRSADRAQVALGSEECRSGACPPGCPCRSRNTAAND